MPEAPSPPSDAQAPLGLKVTLRGVKPPIWRRIVVPRTMTLGELHDVIQVAMGWTDSHLHAFAVGDRQYGDPQQLEGASAEGRVTLNRLIASGVDRFAYTYDFGDGWDHAVLIEKKVPKADGSTLPACVAGARSCPPEDCGGVWGYGELLDILADPEHPERAERLEWLGEEAFDPEAFDLAATNAALAAAFTRRGRGVWVKA